VSIDPLGSVSPSGSQTIQVAPQKKDAGTVDEQVTYTLSASNDCGGSETKTATLHIVGSIEAEPQIAMRSVYFPTDRPKRLKSEDALLPSEQETLKALADSFKKYLEYKPDTHLTLLGHADSRGPQAYNRPLSERRAQLAKNFLVEQGVPEANLETQAVGKEKNLSTDQVKQLLEQNASLSDQDRQKLLQRLPTLVYAYNRRVDIKVSPTGEESAQQYPVQTDDFAALIDRNGPKTGRVVEPAAKKEKIEN
jgi:outer membrane protein OmpA-like peptidoglycan-associated protein